VKSNSKHPSITNLPADSLYLSVLIDVIDNIVKEQNLLGSPRLNFVDCMLHFLLCCIRHAQHNSYRLAIGIGRILHSYQTSEIQQIYEAFLLGEVKEDYQYREVKRDLIRALKNRFGNFLRQHKEKNGEDRFVKTVVTESEWQILAYALETLAIWDKSHINDQFKSFEFQSDSIDSDTWHAIDRKRMHVLTCSRCFDTVTNLAALDTPKKRVSIPEFGGPDDPVQRGGEFKRLSTPEWGQSLAAEIAAILQVQRDLRSSWAGEPLFLQIGGTALGYLLELGRWQSLQISNAQYSGNIEIWSTCQGKQVLLGHHPFCLIGCQNGEVEKIKITLNQSHEISLKLNFIRTKSETAIKISAKYTSIQKTAVMTESPIGDLENAGTAHGTETQNNILAFKRNGSRSPPNEVSQPENCP
jgi:hypothetical protein